MSKTLSVEITDSCFQALIDLSQREGKPPEDLGSQWLTAAVRLCSEDPVLKLSGVIDSETPDLAERHDDYLVGDQLRDEMPPQET